jgi:hypothetical protein
MNKVYLVTYNPTQPFNKGVFHNYITSLHKNGHISDWWHYIDTTYLIVSHLDVNQLYNLIFPGVPQRNLLIIEVLPKNAQGWLPKDAWTWLQKYWQ